MAIPNMMELMPTAIMETSPRIRCISPRANSPCLIEWAENAHELIPEDAIRLKLSYGDDENERIVTFASADENESGAEEYEFQDEGMQELYEVFGEDFSI